MDELIILPINPGPLELIAEESLVELRQFEPPWIDPEDDEFVDNELAFPYDFLFEVALIRDGVPEDLSYFEEEEDFQYAVAAFPYELIAETALITDGLPEFLALIEEDEELLALADQGLAADLDFLLTDGGINWAAPETDVEPVEFVDAPDTYFDSSTLPDPITEAWLMGWLAPEIEEEESIDPIIEQFFLEIQETPLGPENAILDPPAIEEEEPGFFDSPLVHYGLLPDAPRGSAWRIPGIGRWRIPGIGGWRIMGSAREDPIPKEMLVGEQRRIPMEFASDLPGLTISGTPTVAVSAGGPTATSATASGTVAEALFDATGIKPGRYRVLFTCATTGSPAQTLRGRGYIKVDAT
jgi:hypothetical protein